MMVCELQFEFFSSQFINFAKQINHNLKDKIDSK
jgi:hypothetical protein